MAALATAEREMETVAAKRRIREALRAKIPLATWYDVKPGE